MLGLYVHIPFCKKICPYCDFTKRVSTQKTQEIYLNALCEEMKLKKLDQYAFDTLYIGGGTPSMLEIELLKKLFFHLDASIHLSSLKEITFECNPEDISKELCNVLQAFHVNRVSIGVQTFSPKLQNLIGRFTDVKTIQTKIQLLKEAKIDNINIDMMYALPGETMDDLNEDLEKVTSLDIKHLSFYSLILEEHTIFSTLVKKQQLTLIDENIEAKMYHHVVHFLDKYGLKRYETSNFSKNGYQSIHNLIYWNCEKYLALGLGASSYYNDTRFKTTTNLQQYIRLIDNQVIQLEEETILSIDDQMEERILLELRKKEGLDEGKFLNDFGIRVEEKFSRIPQLLEEELLIQKENHLAIPTRYAYITNHIILKIIE